MLLADPAAPLGGSVVVVGVKMDSQSRELLTWALVKVAQPGDCVIALHVLDSAAGNCFSTSFLSLDSVFCVCFVLNVEFLVFFFSYSF